MKDFQMICSPSCPSCACGLDCRNGICFFRSLEYTGHLFHSAIQMTTLAGQTSKWTPCSFLGISLGQPYPTFKHGTTKFGHNSKCSSCLQPWKTAPHPNEQVVKSQDRSGSFLKWKRKCQNKEYLLVKTQQKRTIN